MRIKSKERISGINVYFVPIAEVIQGQSVDISSWLPVMEIFHLSRSHLAEFYD